MKQCIYKLDGYRCRNQLQHCYLQPYLRSMGLWKWCRDFFPLLHTLKVITVLKPETAAQGVGRTMIDATLVRQVCVQVNFGKTYVTAMSAESHPM